MPLCGIYKITNKINNKIYIGKSIDINKRFRDHKNSLNDSSPIHLAMKKYGADNFILEILELCDKNQLDEREIYWINYYNTYLNDNYNAAKGGEGGSHPIKLSEKQVDEIIEKLKQNFSIKQIAKEYSVSIKTISDINTGKSRVRNNIEYPIKKNIFLKKEFDEEELGILLIETQGDFEYIAKLYNCSSMTIRNYCKKIGFSTKRKDYGWVDTQSYHSFAVIRCDKITLEPLMTYTSIRSAARAVKASPQAILNALNSKSHISHGYYWKRKE